jgi:thymidylate synthase (FAD)
MNITILQHSDWRVLLQVLGVCKDKVTSEATIQYAYERGHHGIFEHWSATFHVKGISRITSHQLVRYRIASYAQRSSRSCDESHAGFILPNLPAEWVQEYANLCSRAQELYRNMLAAGVKKEDARYVLPQALETEIIVTMNARELIHFFDSRITREAQWEIRALAELMQALCMEAAPQIFRYRKEKV